MFNKIRKIRTNVPKIMLRKTSGNGRNGAAAPIDETDRRVMRILVNNPRASLREIAAATGISVGTVRDRLYKLNQQKIIKGYRTMIDPRKLGYTMTAIIKIFENQENVRSLESKLTKMPNVFCFYSVAGTTDAVIIARFRDPDELNTFIKSLLAMKHIARTETNIVLDTYKEDFSIEI